MAGDTTSNTGPSPVVMMATQRKRRHWVLFVVIAGILLLGSATAGVLYKRHVREASKQAQARTTGGTKASADNGPVKQYKQQDLNTMVNQDFGPDADKQTVHVLENQNDKTPAQQKLLAVAYINDQQYQKAYAIFDSLQQKNQLTMGDLEGVGETALGNGDKDVAIKYYKLAKQAAQADANNPLSQQTINHANAALKKLGSS